MRLTKRDKERLKREAIRALYEDQKYYFCPEEIACILEKDIYWVQTLLRELKNGILPYKIKGGLN